MIFICESSLINVYSRIPHYLWSLFIDARQENVRLIASFIDITLDFNILYKIRDNFSEYRTFSCRVDRAIATSEQSKGSSYQQSYMGCLDDIQTVLKPLRKIGKKIEINVHGHFRISIIIWNNKPARPGPVQTIPAKPTQPDRNAFRQLISRKLDEIKNWKKKIWGDAKLRT